LENTYSAEEYTNVSSNNEVRVGQTGLSQFIVHEFKNYVGNVSSCTLEWEGQTTLAPSSSIVKLQIYNLDTTTWDDVDTDNVSDANTDFILTNVVDISAHYRNPSNVISCRVWQEAT